LPLVLLPQRTKCREPILCLSKSCMSTALYEPSFYRDYNSHSRIFLTGSYFVVELVAGVWLDSLSLQADAFHMASDIMGLLIALYAENAKVSKKTKLATYGFVRADAVGSLINTTFLLSTCFTISIDALARFREVEELGKRMEESGIPLLIVACIGLGINIIGLLCFGDQMHVLLPPHHEMFHHLRPALLSHVFTLLFAGPLA
jgi:cation diffusion facilitator family transporter